MIPILFEYNATEFTTHGLGDLTECITCEAAVNSEGEYELAFDYPVNGYLFPELTINRIVLAKANDYDPLQAFRIYGYEKEIDGVVKVNCQHISYDISNIPVKAFSNVTTAAAALEKLTTEAMLPENTTCPFTFYTDITDEPHTEDKKFKQEDPATMRAILLDGDDSIKGLFGGDLVFDNWDIKLLKMGGVDRGVTINYGVDLIDLTQEENISEMTTGVLPYFKHSTNKGIVYGDIQYAQGNFEVQRVVPLDVSSYFGSTTTAPTKEQVNAKGQAWVEAEEIGQPEINLTLKYAPLGQDLRLHDAVTVHFERMGIDVKSKVVKVQYDVLREKCTEIEVGKTKPSLLFSLEDASRLKRGLLPPNRIQNGSIGGDKIGGGAVGSGNIGSGAVHDWHIDEGAVTTDAIAENAIEYWHIKDGQIINSKLSDASVSTQKLIEKAVSYSKLDANVQATFVDLLVAKEMFARVIYAEQSVSCSTLIVSGSQYTGQNYAIVVPHYTFDSEGHKTGSYEVSYSKRCLITG